MTSTNSEHTFQESGVHNNEAVHVDSLARQTFYRLLSSSNQEVEWETITREEQDMYTEECEHINSLKNEQLNYLREVKEELDTILHHFQLQLQFEGVQLESERTALKAELIQTAQEIRENIMDISERLENIEATSIEDFNTRNQQIISAIGETLRTRQDLHNQIFANERAHLERRKTSLLKVREQVQSKLNQVNIEIQKIARFGVTPDMANVLLWSGILGAIVCGWTFSEYNKHYDLNSGDSLMGFVIKSVLSINPEPTLLSVGVTIAIPLITIVFITVFLYLTSGRKSNANKETDSDFEFNIGQSESSMFRANIASSSLYDFWLQLVPFIIVACLVAIPVIFSPNALEFFMIVENDLSFQPLGMMVAYVIGAIFYVLLFWIRSNRLSRKKKRALYAIIGLPVIALLLVATIGYFDHSKSFMITVYILLSYLGTAFALAYGYHFKYLFSTNIFLERRMKGISYALEGCENPTVAKMSKKEIKDMQNKLTNAQQNSFQAMRLRFLQIMSSIGISVPQRKSNTNKRDKNSHPETPLHSLFPDMVVQLSYLDNRKIELLEDISSLSQAILKSKSQDELNSVRDRINTIQNKIEDIMIFHRKELQECRTRRDHRRSEIARGRFLFNWVRMRSINTLS